MKGFIYKITNRVNNKVYIGQTRFTIEHRFKQHIKNFNLEHRQQTLYHAFAKYGLENFDIEAIEEVDVNLLDEREKFWIGHYDSFKNGYNATIGGKGGCKYIWTDNQYEEIRSLYLSGFTCGYIANLFNVSRETIISILRSMNIKFRNQPFNINRIEKDRVIESYKNGTSISYIAKQFNTDRESVKRFLIKEGVDLRDHSRIINNQELHDELINDFISGMRFHDMEIKYNADIRTIKKILVMHGININSKRGLRQTTKDAFCLTDEECLEAIKMYNDKIKVKDIANKFGVNVCTIYELFKRYHVKCERYNRSTSVQSLKA